MCRCARSPKSEDRLFLLFIDSTICTSSRVGIVGRHTSTVTLNTKFKDYYHNKRGQLSGVGVRMIASRGAGRPLLLVLLLLCAVLRAAARPRGCWSSVKPKPPGIQGPWVTTARRPPANAVFANFRSICEEGEAGILKTVAARRSSAKRSVTMLSRTWNRRNASGSCREGVTGCGPGEER